MRPAPPRPWLRRLLAVAGPVSAAALIWHAGPLIAIAGRVPLESEPARWAAIGLLAAVWLLQVEWRAARAARRNRALLDGLMAAGARDLKGTTPEVAVLRQRFEQAMVQLKRTRIGGGSRLWAAMRGRPFVYQLPWYVIIGAPGAGKTTALVNSGLEFPLAEKDDGKVLRGVGGTRNCDWWITSEAVLIDTAGRYTTQDSDRSADRAAWLGFLDLLVRFRPRRPINGVLLALSVNDLLGVPAPVRLAHAAELRARIDELQRRLGIRFPIYVLVTKTDLLAGFMEFFADFDKDERAQVWGVTFPHHAKDPAKDPAADPLRIVAGELVALEKRLHECQLERLLAEPDRERRAAIHAFPQQWGLLRETLLDFVQAVFAGAGGQPPLLRGLYFTSATQEGSPVDRALGGLARKLGLAHRVVPPARPSGKTFFVTRLLRDVVFAESGLAGTNLGRERLRATLQWGVAGAAACAVGGVAGVALHAHKQGQDRAAEVAAFLPSLERDAAAARAAPQTELAPLVPVLDAMDALARPATRPAVRYAFGLDAGEQLEAAAHDAYRHLLKDAFLTRMAARLEERLRAADGPGQVERLYEALRAYLMLFGGTNFDRAALRSYLVAEWDDTLAEATPAQRQALQRHLDRLLAGGEVGAPTQADAALIAQARERVARVPLAVRAYGRLRQMDFGADAVPLAAETAEGSPARRVFVRASGRPLAPAVPALFSRVTHDRALVPRTQEVLRQLAAEAPWVLGRAEPQAPQALVAEVRQMVVAEHAQQWEAFIADLRVPAPATLAASAELAQALGRPDSPLVTLLRGVVREAAIEPLVQRFAPLREFVDGQPAPAELLRERLNALATALAAVDDAAKHRGPPPSGDAVRAFATALRAAPTPVRAMLQPLAATSVTQAWTSVREPLARRVAAELAPACQRVVGAGFPFVRSSGNDVPRDAFERLFADGGLLDAFDERYVAPYAEAGAAGDAALPFQRARQVRDAFFVDGGRRFGVRLEMRLLELDPGVAEFGLDAGGGLLRFRRDARSMQVLQWPGPGDGTVKLQLSGGRAYAFEGPWGLLRLLDRVRVEPGAAPGRFQLVFDVEGRKARFEVHSATALNPAQREALEQFRCPG
jgi:type VI secretion system protein ImpL